MPKRKTISMAELAKHGERIAKDIETSGTLYRIKRPGGRGMMLVDENVIESLEATLEIMTRHPNWEQEMEHARNDVEAGRCVTLEELMKRYGLDAEGRPVAKSRAPTRSATSSRPSKSGRSSPRTRAPAS